MSCNRRAAVLLALAALAGVVLPALLFLAIVAADRSARLGHPDGDRHAFAVGVPAL